MNFSAFAALLKGFYWRKSTKLLLVGPMGQSRITATYLVGKTGTANLLILSHANFPLITGTLAELLESMRIYYQYCNAFLLSPFKYEKEAQEEKQVQELNMVHKSQNSRRNLKTRYSARLPALG